LRLRDEDDGRADMSPRPLDHEAHDDFEPFVRRARGGEIEAAIEGVVAAATASRHRESRGRAADALGWIARLAEGGGDLERAERAYGQGLASLEQAEWEEAGAHFRHALSVGDATASVQEFHVRLARGDRAGARQTLLAALAANEGFADLHCLLGTLELEDGAQDDALTSFCRALELRPDYHAARVQL